MTAQSKDVPLSAVPSMLLLAVSQPSVPERSGLRIDSVSNFSGLPGRRVGLPLRRPTYGPIVRGSEKEHKHQSVQTHRDRQKNIFLSWGARSATGRQQKTARGDSDAREFNQMKHGGACYPGILGHEGPRPLGICSRGASG